MSFLHFSPLTVVAGLAGLAGLLLLLQRLRIRHRELVVPTTSFWRQAVEETRARVIVRRFRHPWAYLLVLLIAALAWLALAEPRGRDGDEAGESVMLLDGSAVMSRGARFAETVALLESELARRPAGTVEVVFCGARPRTLAQLGESAVVLRRRLAGLAPEATPGTVVGVLTELARRGVAKPLDVHVFGDTPLPDGLVALLAPELRITLHRAPGPPVPVNRSLAALGIDEAASGDWTRVDLGALATGVTSDDVSLVLEVGGRELARASRPAGGAGVLRLFVPDVEATGEEVLARLDPGDAFPLDDEARLVLPRREPLRVDLDPRLEASLGRLLAADPALRIGADGPDVVVQREASPTLLPALRILDDMRPGVDLLIRHAATDSPELARDTVLGGVPLHVAGRVGPDGGRIRVGVASGEVRGLDVRAELLGPAFDLVDSIAFPLLIGRALRWLAGVEPLRPWVAAGETLDAAGLTDEHGRRIDGAGGAVRPPRAGRYRADDGTTIHASLLGLPDPAPAPRAGASRSEGAEPPWPPAVWAGLLAFALLLVEWVLVKKGRMP